MRSSTKAAKLLPEQSTETQQNEFLNAIASLGDNSVGLSAFSRYSDRFIKLGPVPTLNKVPPTLRSLYFSEKNRLLSKTELQDLCNTKFNQLHISTEEINHLEEMTRNQSLSTTWHDHRLGRITSSIAGDMLKTNKEHPAPSLIKTICDTNKTKLSVPAVLWGAEHEEDGFVLYSNLYSRHHQQPSSIPTGHIYMTNPGPHLECKVSKAGFLISRDRPYLGASPDGFVNCSCCGKGVIEIKCPYKYKDLNMKDVISDDSFYLSANFHLKQTSKYYAQVQHQIYVCDVAYADFVVWTPLDCIITRVNRNDTFIGEMIYKFEFLWKNHVLPELLTRQMENNTKEQFPASESASDVQTYCKCNTNSDLDNMVGCDRCDNWFHPKCIGQKRLPKT